MSNAKKVHGVNFATGVMLGDAISREKAAPPEKANARCNKCGGDLKATPAILAPIRMGVVDHAGCGGQFVEIPNAD